MSCYPWPQQVRSGQAQQISLLDNTAGQDRFRIGGSDTEGRVRIQRSDTTLGKATANATAATAATAATGAATTMATTTDQSLYLLLSKR